MISGNYRTHLKSRVIAMIIQMRLTRCSLMRIIFLIFCIWNFFLEKFSSDFVRMIWFVLSIFYNYKRKRKKEFIFDSSISCRNITRLSCAYEGNGSHNLSFMSFRSDEINPSGFSMDRDFALIMRFVI